MNILAIFCLNALSENEESHPYIRESGVSFSIHNLDYKSNKTAVEEVKDDESAPSKVDVKEQRDYNGQSLFNRINFLLEYHEQKKEGSTD